LSTSFENHPPNEIVCDYGPVINEGLNCIELRLEHGVRVFLSLDGAILVENGNIRMAISSNHELTALEHPNGRTFQHYNHTDILAIDGLGKNGFV
jgi:hypothetical protein